MRGAGVIARTTLGELTRRRVFPVVLLLTAAFLALYELANQLAFRTLSESRVNQNGTLVDSTTLAGATLLGLAMFATLFLGAVVAVFLTMSAVRGDAEQGLLQPLVVRRPGRLAFVAGRFAAAALVCSVYTLAVYLAAVLITGQAGGWWPDRLLLPGLELALGTVILAAMALLGSVFMSTIANGIAILMAYGAGLVAGLLGQVGYALPSHRLQQLGKIASWALPFDALYQSGLHTLTVDTEGLTGVVVHLGPLGGAQAAGPLLGVWAVAYLGALLALTALGFARRDL